MELYKLNHFALLLFRIKIGTDFWLNRFHFVVGWDQKLCLIAICFQKWDHLVQRDRREEVWGLCSDGFPGCCDGLELRARGWSFCLTTVLGLCLLWGRCGKGMMQRRGKDNWSCLWSGNRWTAEKPGTCHPQGLDKIEGHMSLMLAGHSGIQALAFLPHPSPGCFSFSPE
jgi:hypothetical protein